MINYREADVKCHVEGRRKVSAWIKSVVVLKGKSVGEINIVSCSDELLLDTNVRFLEHDYYTDIITFDNTEGDLISGDLMISFDRVKENAKNESVQFQEELRRVIIHGVLHLIGYGDKTDDEAKEMRAQENKALKMFHVERLS